MIKRIVRFFRRLKLRFYLWSKKGKMFKTYEEEVSSYEKTCFQICLQMIKHPSTKFMIAPMSDKRYLKNDQMGIFITMSERRVEITNHVFNYNVKLLNRDWERLVYIFDTETEKRRLEMEKDVSSNIKNSLDHVLDRLNKITENE